MPFIAGRAPRSDRAPRRPRTGIRGCEDVLLRRNWSLVLLLAVPAVAWAGVLYWLSAQPGSAFQEIGAASPVNVPGRDYYVHVGLYGVLGSFLWLWARLGLGGSKGASVAVAVCLAVLYGVSDEWHQSFVPGRTPDARDVLADGAGALIAVLTLWALSAYWSRRARLSLGETHAGG